MSLCRFRGRRSTLDMVVVFGVLCCRGRARKTVHHGVVRERKGVGTKVVDSRGGPPVTIEFQIFIAGE